MKPLNSTLTASLILLAMVASGATFAEEHEWHHGRGHAVAPRAHDDVHFGFSVSGPVWYESAPGYYYYSEPAPMYYYQPAPPSYYRPAPSYYYYRDDDDSWKFPRSDD